MDINLYQATITATRTPITKTKLYSSLSSQRPRDVDMSTDTTTPAEPRPKRLTFGVELEFLVPIIGKDDDDPFAHIEGLPPVFRLNTGETSSIGSSTASVEVVVHDRIRSLLSSHGLPTEVRAYKYETEIEEEFLGKYSHWSVKEDGTLRELGSMHEWAAKYEWVDIEVISPVEPDVPTAFEIIDYARQLISSTYRCRVNPSTGLHVHVGQGIERFPLQSIRRIASLAWSAENLLLTLEHPSRRANYYCRTLRNQSRLSRGRESGGGPNHERVPRMMQPHSTWAGRPLSAPRLCLHYIAADLRHGEQPISWRENEDNNETEYIEAFQKTRREGCFYPFQPDSKSIDSKMVGKFKKKYVDGVLDKGLSLDDEIMLRFDKVLRLGGETEAPRGIPRRRTIPRIKCPHYNAEQLKAFSKMLQPYGGGGVNFDKLGTDPGVWEGVRQIFESPSSCDVEYLLDPGYRGYISLRPYSCESTISTFPVGRTVEFRGAEGTLGEWVVAWAKICVGLVKFAILAPPDEFLRVLENCDIGERVDGSFDVIDLIDAIGLPAEAEIAEKRIEKNREAWNLDVIDHLPALELPDSIICNQQSAFSSTSAKLQALNFRPSHRDSYKLWRSTLRLQFGKLIDDYSTLNLAVDLQPTTTTKRRSHTTLLKMLVQTIAVLGLASSALATYPPQALKQLRDLRAEHVVVEVRQAQSSSTPTITETGVAGECMSSASAIITDAPTPASGLLSYFQTFASTADLSNPSLFCQVTQNVPQSLSANYSSFDQQASSWFSKHSSDIAGLASKCGDNEDAASVSQVVSALDVYVANGCSSSSSSSVSHGLAARPTGMVAGAMAAAGVMGVAAVL
ncbi:hypothetical protein F5Y05DRAFT_417095 [Hypoxylon sp. FL0543]|nr:hypothetical protein F5Y05DRAFT_417095 [Hypoxylon sp. FL0543]